MIKKHIQPRKLTNKNVHRYTFPGKTADKIENEINLDGLKAIPSHAIIHAGTNTLRTESPTIYANKIEKLGAEVKNQFPYSKIGLSGQSVRHGNSCLKNYQRCQQRAWELICAKLNISFIDSSSIHDTYLDKNKLHLNAKGLPILAVHLINH